MTKATIVQRLLNSKYINAEEAVILLSGEKEYIYVPTTPPQPIQYPTTNPWITYQTSTGNNLSDNALLNDKTQLNG